ncbi:hypothetical protein DICPUDRAFT_91862 [Dictyostelium purpureum]|uniref:WH1 domain-containing protein n=1 Tax=Dictyostelium purpureum TaxID=5786 RepID=F0ZIE1_DICPU|nr:uncharacterized protein DICPUDRAFT_91862 [Dictyostelium purpureum]EGC36309.1 hypothetical protein DICPUDRAFT_91862 [Dictyostelium purpureum]|eukprot:XP_003287187.1 hypothetical protein DICPUDRAFT_91862 [Dictyostelium purpureum]
MSETAIFNATGQVFTYNPQVRNWVPSSNVPATLQMYYNSSANTYRVIGRAGDDPNNFLINFAVKSDVVYSRASEVFHQFTDQRTHFGINFTSKPDADTFGGGFEKVLATLKGGAPPAMKPAAPPQQPAPQRPASTTIAKPVAPAAPAAPSQPPAAPAPPAPPAPPKPPGPPPPPPAAGAPKPASGAGRGALLGSIENFSKNGLKKTVTVDKSNPLIGNTPAAPAPSSGGSTPASGGSTPAASTPKVSSGGGGGDLMAEVMAKRAKMKAAAAQPKEESTPVRDTPAPAPTPSHSFNKPSTAPSFNKPSKPAAPPQSTKPSLSPSSTASPPSTVASEDLQSLKEEILAEVRKELKAMKDEILEAIRNSH